MILKSEDEIEFLKEKVFEIRDVIGEMAEVGVYEGDSAKVILKAMIEAKHSQLDWKLLNLFDTFEGFLKEQILEGENYKEGDLKSNYQPVKYYFDKFPNVKVYAGDVIETKEKVSDRKFSFVHLDLDIYKPTIECLEFFWQRLNTGGIILIDDYCPTNWGIIKATNEFISKYNIELKRGVSRLAYIKK